MTGPSTNGDNGENSRDNRGRFAPGNAGGPGNPHAAKVAGWRTALADAVTDDNIRTTIQQLIEKAKVGERWAVKELLDRTIGRLAKTLAITAINEIDQNGVRVMELELDDRT